LVVIWKYICDARTYECQKLTETSKTTWEYVTKTNVEPTDYLPSSFLTSSWLMNRFRWPLTPRRDHRVVNSKADHSTRDHSRPILTVLRHLLHSCPCHVSLSSFTTVSVILYYFDDHRDLAQILTRSCPVPKGHIFILTFVFLKEYSIIFNTTRIFVVFSIYWLRCYLTL